MNIADDNNTDSFFLDGEGIGSAAFLHYLRKLNTLSVHSLVMRKDGKTVSEIYWQPYNAKEKQIMFSVSKSFTAVAMMFLVQDGLCRLDTQIYDILRDEVDFIPSEAVQKVTIEHLLSMTYGAYEEGIQKFYLESDWLKASLALTLVNEPGKVFFYDNRCPFLCSAIVKVLTGKNLLEYLKLKLLDALAIYDVSWEKNTQGYDKGAYGLSITTRDLAKFGQFLLNGGNWQGRQLLAAEYVKKLLTVHISTQDCNLPEAAIDNEQGYGCYFWKCLPEEAFRASGLFGQSCIILPRQQMVIAITSGAQAEQKEAILMATWEFLASLKTKAIYSKHSEKNSCVDLLQKYIKTCEIALPSDDGIADERLLKRSFSFSDNNLGIGKLILTRQDSKTLHIELALANRKCSLTAKQGFWQANITDAEHNDDFDSCGTIFWENPYIAYGWQKGKLILKIVYNQGIFIDTMKLNYIDDGLTLTYLPTPEFSIRTIAQIIRAK